MTRDSLQDLLELFPDFFDKSEVSNFYMSQSVTNNQFKNLGQSLFDIVESIDLRKKCFIWKEQLVPYDYRIYFCANYPHIKNVKCYKNDEMICIEDYTYEENKETFHYIYDSTNETNTLLENSTENTNPLIIPDDTFKIIIETYDEILIEKGFPENDEIQGNEYDHDISLDEIGAQNNIPRKKYAPTSDYQNTEPPYNNCLSEDDYHYMNRIIKYNLRLHTTPLPVLELWKIYGITANMINRESSLFKMFDENRHEPDWTPSPWEHKDQLCTPIANLGKFLLVSANTTLPHKNQVIRFTFRYLNMYAEPLTTNATVSIYLNNTLLEENYNYDTYSINSSQLEGGVNIFKFVASDDDGIFSTQEMSFRVIGCDDANWYVSDNGDDTNDGKTPQTSFATIQKAANMVESEENFIVVRGTHTINTPVKIKNNCTILGCNNATIENTTCANFFEVPVNKKLEISDLTLNYDTISSSVTTMELTNNSDQTTFVRIIEDWED